jgi:HK97 gp10 family phage protein
MANEVRVTGLEGVVRNLRALPKSISGKGGGPLRFGMLKAAQFMRDKVKANAVFTRGFSTGNLRNQIISIRDRNPREKNNATERYFVTVRRSKSKTPGGRGSNFGSARGAFYAHFLEFGTKKQDAQPFMRTAFESNKAESINVLVVAIKRRLATELKKLAKRK